MATEVYNGTFKSLRNGDDYYLCITNDYTTSIPVSADRTYLMGEEGFVLERNGEDDIFTSLITSSVKFQFIAQGSSPESDLETILADGDTPWYVIIWKNEAFYWWGYLNVETISKGRDYYPITYNLEAFDKLTTLGQQSIWDYEPTNAPTTNNTIFGFGWRQNWSPVSVNSQIPAFGWVIEPTNGTYGVALTYSNLLGFIYSLIFDSDAYETDEQDFKVVSWDTRLGTDTANVSRLFEQWRMEGIGYFFHNDPNNFRYNGGEDGLQHRNWNVAQLLDQICKLFRARIFQRNGVYHMVQWEAYQGDPVNGYLYVHTYNNAQVSGIPGGSFTIMPNWDSTQTLSTQTDWKISLAAPRTNPDILNGASYTYNRPIEKAQINIRTSPGNDETETFEKQLSWTISSNGPFSNFTQSARYRHEFSCSFPYSWLSMQNSSGQLKRTSFRYDGTNYVAGTPYEHYLSTRAEYSNGRRAILDCTLYGEYDFFKVFTLDSIVWIPVSESFVAAMDEHKIRAVEFESNANGINDTVKKTTNYQADPGGGIKDSSSRKTAGVNQVTL